MTTINKHGSCFEGFEWGKGFGKQAVGKSKQEYSSAPAANASVSLNINRSGFGLGYEVDTN